MQDRRKWLFRVKFFSFKSAWIFACAFQFSRKTFSCIFFLAEMLLFRFVMRSFCMLRHFDFVFLRSKVQTSRNKILLNWKAHAKFRHFWRKKHFTRKSHLRLSCTKPFNYYSHIHCKLLTVKLYSYHVLHYNYSHVFWYLQVINTIYTAPMCSLQMIKTPQKLITLSESQIEQNWSTFHWVWNL